MNTVSISTPPTAENHLSHWTSTARKARELLRQLALQSDVVVENFRPGVLSDIGLDPESLRTEKPELIIASVSGFGTAGPLSQAAGLDQVAQGMSGLMSITGADAENVYRVGVPVIDMYAGVFIAFGIASALAGKGTQRGWDGSFDLAPGVRACHLILPGPAIPQHRRSARAAGQQSPGTVTVRRFQNRRYSGDHRRRERQAMAPAVHAGR
jgi:hypothetical protein